MVPTTLEDAMALARTCEQHLNMGNDLTLCPPQCSSGRTGTAAKALALPASATATTSPTPCLKWLTPEEMAVKQEHGECYNYTEKFSHEHLKVCPMKGIYLLQKDDVPGEAAEIGEDPLISLNAITGLTAADTMQLDIRVADEPLRALIDSGSTHSFISVAAASRLHLDILPRPDLGVKVANGDRVVTAGVCHATHVFIDTEEFIIDLFVIPLDGYNVVLGMH
jgi:hypothetical protein